MSSTARRSVVAILVAALTALAYVLVPTIAHATDATISRVQTSHNQNYSAGSTMTTGTAGTLSAAATAGDLLVLQLSCDKACGTITWPTGYTNVQQRSGASVTVGVATKVAAGGETSAGTMSWATAQHGYAAALHEYSGASGVDSSIIAPATYSDTAVTSLSVDPPAATAGGLALVLGAIDTVQNTTDFNPASTGYTFVTANSDASGVGTPGYSLTQRSSQHTAGTNLAASTFSWTRSDQAQMVEVNLAAKQTGSAAPVASFTESPSSGTAPVTVGFTDTSTNTPTSWSWVFGDGLGTSTSQNPSHVYDHAGTYTVTETATNSLGSSSTTGTVTVSNSGTGWVQQLDDEFNSGGVPSHWALYDGPYGSSPNNCATPSHDTVSGGYLHLLESYESTTPTGGQCGAAWYTGGMQLSSTFAAVNQRITLRWRMVSTDPANATDPNTGVISHNNMPMHFGNGTGCWPTPAQGGETDYMEGADPTTMSSFIHYGANCGDTTQFASPDYTSADFRSWHTVRAERNNHTINVYIDNMSTPVYTKVGDSTSLPDVAQRAVLQQECRATGCPATTSPTTGYSADVQVDWVTVDNFQ